MGSSTFNQPSSVTNIRKKRVFGLSTCSKQKSYVENTQTRLVRGKKNPTYGRRMKLKYIHMSSYRYRNWEMKLGIEMIHMIIDPCYVNRILLFWED